MPRPLGSRHSILFWWKRIARAYLGIGAGRILSYRRLKENDPWTSEYFDMEELLGSLELGDDISLGFLEQDMLKPYCRCGRFRLDTPHREQTAKYYFGNLDDYTRLTAISLPGRQCKFTRSFPPFPLDADNLTSISGMKCNFTK